MHSAGQCGSGRELGEPDATTPARAASHNSPTRPGSHLPLPSRTPQACSVKGPRRSGKLTTHRSHGDGHCTLPNAIAMSMKFTQQMHRVGDHRAEVRYASWYLEPMMGVFSSSFHTWLNTRVVRHMYCFCSLHPFQSPRRALRTFSVQSPADSRYLAYIGCRMMLHTVPWCPARHHTTKYWVPEKCTSNHSTGMLAPSAVQAAGARWHTSHNKHLGRWSQCGPLASWPCRCTYTPLCTRAISHSTCHVGCC
jgi:hypothetical protein